MPLFKKEFNYPLINFTVFLCLLFLGISNIEYIVKFFLNILSVLFPFLLGFVVSYAINPFVVFLQKKLSRKFAVIIVVGMLTCVMTFLFISILPLLYHQIAGFSIQLIQMFGNLENRISFPLALQEIAIKFSSFLIQSVGKITFATTVDVIFFLIHFLSQFVLVFISVIYFLFYMDVIRKKVKNILVINNFKLYSFFRLLDKNMLCYVKSLGIFMLVQFVEYSLLFFIIGHPYWLVLGILIGIFTIFPYIGGLLSNLIAITSAFMISKELFYLTLFISFFFPIIDEYIISPKVYGKRNDIHPIITIFLLSLGGTVGGVLGIIFVIPLFLFLRTLVLFFWNDMKSGAKNIKDIL